MVAPSQVPPAEYPGAMMPKELEDHEIEEILADYAAAARRVVAAGLDAVEFHMAHGYLPWQFLRPSTTTAHDRWGGSYERRLRFPVEAMRRIRASIGEEPFMGYRINSRSFWEGDLELRDIQQIVGDFDEQLDVDYMSLSAGVHHSFIHTPRSARAPRSRLTTSTPCSPPKASTTWWSRPAPTCGATASRPDRSSAARLGDRQLRDLGRGYHRRGHPARQRACYRRPPGLRGTAHCVQTGGHRRE